MLENIPCDGSRYACVLYRVCLLIVAYENLADMECGKMNPVV